MSNEVFIIECLCHDYKRFDPREQKDVPARLYLWDEQGPPMSPDIIWLQSITRPDSGTWFTTSEGKALKFPLSNEQDADAKLSDLVLSMGYLPGDLTLTKIAPKDDEERR